MQYKVFFANCGKCRICRDDKSAKPHGPYLKLRVSRSHGVKEEDYIGRLLTKEPLPAKECPAPGCGETFMPKVAWQDFCSDRCRVRAHYHANKLRAEHLGNEYQVKKSKKEGTNMKKQKQGKQDQPPVTQQVEPTPPAPVQPAPTLAAMLLAVIETWQQANGLNHEQFEAAIEKVWQTWR